MPSAQAGYKTCVYLCSFAFTSADRDLPTVTLATLRLGQEVDKCYSGQVPRVLRVVQSLPLLRGAEVIASVWTDLLVEVFLPPHRKSHKWVDVLDGIRMRLRPRFAPAPAVVTPPQLVDVVEAISDEGLAELLHPVCLLSAEHAAIDWLRTVDLLACSRSMMPPALPSG